MTTSVDYNIEKECSALGVLFTSIMTDMKTSAPIWEDFVSKTTKLHSTLRATVIATGAFLEAFQRIADLATNGHGATRELGSALTRLCMRHRSIESRLKEFTNALIENVSNPINERLEDWKKSVVVLDKDHAREYKKARQDIKRASSDTVKLQKKVKKGQSVMTEFGKSDIQQRLEIAMQDVTGRYLVLEETEKNAVRNAMIEERARFCHFVTCVRPVVDHEISMLGEVTHLQEIMENLCLQAAEPQTLPKSAEQVISDLKGNDAGKWSFTVPDQSPPSSPSSLGSRKSSMCSINSISSSNSGSNKSHSPSHHVRHRNSSQPQPGAVRLSSVSSQDSGFTSQDAIFMKPPSPNSLDIKRKSSLAESSSGTSTESSTPSPSYPGAPPSTSASTWTNWPEPPYAGAGPLPHGQAINQSQDATGQLERPHTISTAYEKTHHRPPLTAATFQPPEGSQTVPHIPSQQQATYAVPCLVPKDRQSMPPSGMRKIYDMPNSQRPPETIYEKPMQPKVYDVPQQPIYDTIQREKIYDSAGVRIYAQPPALGPKQVKGKPVAPPMVPDFNAPKDDQFNPGQPPMYVNMNQLASMAAQNRKERHSVHDRPPNLEGTAEERNAAKRVNRSMSLPAQAPDNSELANAIRALEKSTAELQQSYDEGQQELEENDYNDDRCKNSKQISHVQSFGSSQVPKILHHSQEDLSPLEVRGRSSRPTVQRSNTFATIPRNRSAHSFLGSNRSISLDDGSGQGEKPNPKFKPPLPKRPTSTAASMRRSSLNKPPPPVRRSSSISGPPGGGAPLLPGGVPSQPNNQPNNQQRVPPHILAHSQSVPATSAPVTPAGPRRIMSDSSSLCSQTGSTMTQLSDLSDEEFLPPPPPELLHAAHAGSGDNAGVPADPMNIKRHRGSVQESHASIINVLNQRFSSPPTANNTTQPNMPLHQRPTNLPDSSAKYNNPPDNMLSPEDATPTADCPPDSFLSQIRRGVSLKRSSTNDRSAPKLN